MALEPPLRLELRRLAGARRPGGHEVHLPPALARGFVQPLDFVGFVGLEVDPPLGRAANVVPDSLHRVRVERARVAFILPARLGVHLRRRLAGEALVKICQATPLDVEPHPDTHAAGISSSGSR